MNQDLLVVMPVFNEQASIETVVRDWHVTLREHGIRYSILAIDDGSTDHTPAILRQLRGELGPCLETYSRPNRGHGQSCLEGYRLATRREVPFVLQIDSDGQCAPEHFQRFWEIRHDFDVIYGRRRRDDGLRRIIASSILRFVLRIGFHVTCTDPNVPYRLMRTAACAPCFDRIPPDFHLANVALAALLASDPEIRHGSVPIRFLQRLGGEPSVPFSKFAAKGVELVRQLKQIEPFRGMNPTAPP